MPLWSCGNQLTPLFLAYSIENTTPAWRKQTLGRCRPIPIPARWLNRPAPFRNTTATAFRLPQPPLHPDLLKLPRPRPQQAATAPRSRSYFIVERNSRSRSPITHLTPPPHHHHHHHHYHHRSPRRPARRRSRPGRRPATSSGLLKWLATRR